MGECDGRQVRRGMGNVDYTCALGLRLRIWPTGNCLRPANVYPPKGRLQNARLCSTQQHQNSSYHAYAGEIQGGNHSKMFWVPAYSVDFMAALSACTGKLYSIV